MIVEHRVTPKTWATLLTSLQEIEKMATVTSDIQKELEEHNNLAS